MIKIEIKFKPLTEEEKEEVKSRRRGSKESTIQRLNLIKKFLADTNLKAVKIEVENKGKTPSKSLYWSLHRIAKENKLSENLKVTFNENKKEVYLIKEKV